LNLIGKRERKAGQKVKALFAIWLKRTRGEERRHRLKSALKQVVIKVRSKAQTTVSNPREKVPS
jgi:hypothetical protein